MKGDGDGHLTPTPLMSFGKVPQNVVSQKKYSTLTASSFLHLSLNVTTTMMMLAAIQKQNMKKKVVALAINWQFQ